MQAPPHAPTGTASHRTLATDSAREPRGGGPVGSMIEDITFGSANARYQSQVVQSYGGSAVRMAGSVKPGGSTALIVTLRTPSVPS